MSYWMWEVPRRRLVPAGAPVDGPEPDGGGLWTRLSGPGEVSGMREDMLKNAQLPPLAPAAVAAKPNEPRIGPNSAM